MADITPREQLPVRVTPLGGDILDVQDTTGATWYKITLTAIAEFARNVIRQTSNTWTGTQNFTGATITVPVAAGPTEPVTLTQLGTKQNSISSSNTEIIYNNGGNIVGATFALLDNSNQSMIIQGAAQEPTFNASQGFLRLEEEFTPTGPSDGTGSDGDITHDRDYIYMKTAGTWKRSPIFTSF